MLSGKEPTQVDLAVVAVKLPSARSEYPNRLVCRRLGDPRCVLSLAAKEPGRMFKSTPDSGWWLRLITAVFAASAR